MAANNTATLLATQPHTSHPPAEHHGPNTYPVFKGLGRKATFMGVPTKLLLGAFAGIAIIAMTAGLAWWGLLFVVMPTLAILTREDDKAVDVLMLELKTRRRNRNKRFWRGSSYAPQSYHGRRPWRTLIK